MNPLLPWSPRRLVARAALLFAAAVPAHAQQVEAPRLAPAAIQAAWANAFRGAPMPRDVADLDRLWAAKDYAALVPRLRAVSTAADLELVLNWERARILDGGGFVIVYAYMSDLWRFGAALPPAQGDGLKQTAGAMFAYAVTLVALDGTKCEDTSAPGHRRDQLLSQNPDLLRYVAAQSRAARMTMGTVALAFDAATRTLRRNDDVLCRGGMSEMTAGLKAQGDKPMEQAPSTPGMVGKTLLVPPAPGFAPGFVGEPVWRPKQEALRPQMEAALTKLLTVPVDGAPAAPPSKP